MKRPSYPILAVAAGAILLLSVIVFRRYLPYTGRGLAPKEPPAIVLTMEDTYLVGLGHGGKLWSLKARRVEMARNRSTTTLTHITDGKVFDRGKVALKVRAGRAVYDIYYKDLQLGGGVRIEGNRGQVISATTASWNSANAVLRSGGQVTFQSPWSRMTAESLMVDVRKKQMDMWNVAMVVDMKKVGSPMSREAGLGVN